MLTILYLGDINTFWYMSLCVYSLTIEINLKLYKVAIKKKNYFVKKFDNNVLCCAQSAATIEMWS